MENDMTRRELAEELLDDNKSFGEVLNEWVDYDTQVALIRAIYQTAKQGKEYDLNVFAKSLVAVIDDAAYRAVAKDYEYHQALSSLNSWGDEADARRSFA
jgi:hypothetical protein